MDKEDIKKILTEEEYRVTQEKGTEMPFQNKYWDRHEAGMYNCKVCGKPLFLSDAKFDSGTGWPSFDRAIDGAVKFNIDESHGMVRTEVVCANCGAHLGHMFSDGPSQTTGQRFCMNSCALDLKPDEGEK